MSTALTKHETGLSAMQMNESELMEVLQSSLYPGANPASIKMVLGYCKASDLDPMQKPVHIVPMWDGKARQMRDVVMPGIGLYRTQAARTGEHIGTDEPVFGPMVELDLSGVKIAVPEWCKVTVYRMVLGQKSAYTAIEYWTENYATAGKDTRPCAKDSQRLEINRLPKKWKERPSTTSILTQRPAKSSRSQPARNCPPTRKPTSPRTSKHGARPSKQEGPHQTP